MLLHIANADDPSTTTARFAEFQFDSLPGCESSLEIVM